MRKNDSKPQHHSGIMEEKIARGNYFSIAAIECDVRFPNATHSNGVYFNNIAVKEKLELIKKKGRLKTLQQT